MHKYCATPSKVYLLYILAFSLGVYSCHSSLPADEAIAARLPEVVDYNYHIKPLLSDRCYSCHGPDANTREADLRLDTEEGAFKTLTESGKKAIVKGSLRKSAIWHRIMEEDPNELMPPPESNLSLNSFEIALIGKWIDQGAKWKKHWAFIPLAEAPVPSNKNTSWPKNEIDFFTLDRMEREGVSPSPIASKERLIRRLSFDLRGLPPTLEEIDAFVMDDSPGAYEKWVDRFLAAPEFGERMAMDWMDVARYADSHGLHADGWRNMWPWRDWVIRAFNENMPYDQFILEQLAGDMLPDATSDQILATAFHRNHPMTAEGGIVDEEYRLEYVFDRTNTTATAFLGVTMECARCHDHKFDPISQKEYYQLAAFFNNVKELGMTGDDGNYGPMLTMMSDSVRAVLKGIDTELEKVESQLELPAEEVLAQQEFLRKHKNYSTESIIKKGDFFPLEAIIEKRNKGGKKGKRADGDIRTNITGEVERVRGKNGKAFRFDHDYDVLYLSDMGLFEMTDPFSVSLWVNPEKSGEHQTLIGNTGNKNNFWRGWELSLDTSSQVLVKFIHSLPHNYLHLQSLESIPKDTWTHLAFTYDGTGQAKGLNLYINGQKVETKVYFDRLSKSILPITSNHQLEKRALRVAKSYRAFTGDNGIFLGALDEIGIFPMKLSAWEVWQLAEVDKPAPKSVLQDHLSTQHTYQQKDLLEKRLQLQNQKLAILDTLSEVMVMEEMPNSRPMYVYDRGQYDLPTDQIGAGTPASILTFPEDYTQNRMGLAKWLTDPRNPLTSRVTVNRYWQMIFGKGLVATPQDFGNQGTLPTHPELLDALAFRFMENGWNVKDLIKFMVMSATYQQDSKMRGDLTEKDPDNLLLARGPSYRLPAEMIRDNALAASGLLNQTIGGPSVKPYQPAGLWIDKGSFSPKLLHYKADTLEGMHRRSLYTFIRRTSPPPSMQAFDAPNREICTVQRQNTNTPMQALVLLNDPQFVEAARKMGERIWKEGGDALTDKIRYGFRLATGRNAKEDEVELFQDMFQDEYKLFEENPHRAKELLSVGVLPVEVESSSHQLAALTIVSNMMLNHDEAYMKR